MRVDKGREVEEHLQRVRGGRDFEKWKGWSAGNSVGEKWDEMSGEQRPVCHVKDLVFILRINGEPW